MNHPVPVSTKGVGRTVTERRPQLIVTSARTSAVTSATAGLASRMASCTVTAAVAAGASSMRAASPRPRAAFIVPLTLTREPAGAQSGRGEYNARMPSRTDANLQVALAGEADANRRYLAYGIRALAEGRADIAQLFFEAAGAETIHALEHLRAMGAVGSTRENLVIAATGEMQEIDVTLPRMIREADEDGRPDAAASFRLALERERHHRDMFRHALATFDGAPATAASTATSIAAPAAASGAATEAAAATSIAAPAAASVAAPVGMASAPGPTAPRRAPGAVAGGGVTAAAMRRMDGRAHMSELDTEPARIERLASIREVVFGA